jgi:hypothetical protein
MAKVKIVRGRAAITERNMKHYVRTYTPYVSLLISIIALLKAYHVFL